MNIPLRIGAPLMFMVGVLPASGKPSDGVSRNPVVQQRCTTLNLTSESRHLPLRLVQPYLERRQDFQSSRLILAGMDTTFRVVKIEPVYRRLQCEVARSSTVTPTG